MTKKLVIAIDGPSASGKGTLAKKVAKHFGLAYLNTGAIYRLIALRVINSNIDPDNFEGQISDLTKGIFEQDLENEELFSEKVGFIDSIIVNRDDNNIIIIDNNQYLL